MLRPAGESTREDMLLISPVGPANVSEPIDAKHLPHLQVRIAACVEILRYPQQERCIKYSMLSTGLVFLMLTLLCLTHAAWDTWACKTIDDQCGKFRIPEVIGMVFFSILSGIALLTALYKSSNRSPLLLLTIDELKFIKEVGDQIDFDITDYSTLASALLGLYEKVQLASPHYSVSQHARLFARAEPVPMPTILEVLHPQV